MSILHNTHQNLRIDHDTINNAEYDISYLNLRLSLCWLEVYDCIVEYSCKFMTSDVNASVVNIYIYYILMTSDDDSRMPDVYTLSLATDM